jgi:Zn-dependent peptidase ImmA (M78 family)
MYVWNENIKQEIEANEFSASILMPAEIKRDQYDKQ